MGLVLWKIGLLTAMFRLTEDDREDFGLSNTLMMLDDLLRYRHPDLTPDMLDIVERFLEGDKNTRSASRRRSRRRNGCCCCLSE